MMNSESMKILKELIVIFWHK